MILSKSKIYETRLISLDLIDEKFTAIFYEVPRTGIETASYRGYKKLIDFFVYQEADNWDGAMMFAVSEGYVNLVQFFISKEADDFYWKCSSYYRKLFF